MKKIRISIKLLYVLISVLLLACNKDDDQPTPDDSGYLSMNVSISVASESASGRTTTGNVDDFFIAVYDINDVLIVSYEKLSEAPPEIELITGEYYVVAHSDNQEDAAFDNPYYYGRSDNFTIDKEELKTIDIVAELANSKVSIHYSDILIETFNSYSGSVEVVSSGTKLNYSQGETREGYFLPEPLYVEVNLSYSKLDGSYITRTFTANIDAQPKTLYKVMVDASLANGKIVFNLIVDDSFNEEEVNIGETTGDLPLIGTTWTLVSLELIDCDDPIYNGFFQCPADCEVMSFNEDGSFVSTDPDFTFDQFTYSYLVEGDILTIVTSDGTSDYLDVYTYEIHGDELTLSDPDPYSGCLDLENYLGQ